MEKKKVSTEVLYDVIKETIRINKSGVIVSLKKSFVDVNSTISDNDLFHVVIRELQNGNGYLAFHLENVINSSGDSKDYSNIAPLILAGLSILPSLFGGGNKDNGAAAAAAAAQNQQMQMQFQMAQQQAAREQRVAESRRQEAAAKRSANLIIFGGIAGVLVLGLGTWLMMRKK